MSAMRSLLKLHLSCPVCRKEFRGHTLTYQAHLGDCLHPGFCVDAMKGGNGAVWPFPNSTNANTAPHHTTISRIPQYGPLGNSLREISLLHTSAYICTAVAVYFPFTGFSNCASLILCGHQVVPLLLTLQALTTRRGQTSMSAWHAWLPQRSTCW